MEEVASTVSSSSRSDHNIPQLVKDPDKPVIFYDWRAFLQHQFKPLKHLTKYHHFKVTSSEPNVVVCRKFVDSEEVCKIAMYVVFKKTFVLILRKVNLVRNGDEW